MGVLQRADLIEMYDEILQRGLGQADFLQFKETGKFRPGIIVQSSSGSSGNTIFRIPRVVADIQDIFSRTLIPYLEVFPKLPQRIAMLGGISHLEAAINFQLKTTSFKSFTLNDLSELASFDPEVISCYPSIARELIANTDLKLGALLAFKFGGEPLLDIDLRKIRNRFPHVAIFEQVGSTEMPALAIGLREKDKARRLKLQRQRFSFDLQSGNDWQPLLVKDNFPQLLFPIPEYYDMNDDVIVEGDYLLQVRRRKDAESLHRPLMESLLEAGARNIQIDLESNSIIVDADVLPNIQTSMPMRLGKMKRLHPSNKLPLVLGATK